MFNCIYVKLMTGTYRLDKVGSPKFSQIALSKNNAKICCKECLEIGHYCCFSLSQVVVRLVGTKKACGQGGCGACTVMVSRIDRQQHKIQYP